MSYPTSYDDYPDDEAIADVNVPNNNGGPGSLPDTEAYHGSDVDMGGATTWNPDYSGL